MKYALNLILASVPGPYLDMQLLPIEKSLPHLTYWQIPTQLPQKRKGSEINFCSLPGTKHIFFTFSVLYCLITYL